MQALPGGEYGLVGAVLLAVVGALIWYMRTMSTRLLDIVQANTTALVELRAALRGQRLCPYSELIAARAGGDCDTGTEDPGPGGGGGSDQGAGGRR